MISIPCTNSIDKRAVPTVQEGDCSNRQGLDDPLEPYAENDELRHERDENVFALYVYGP
jgi:hypothetical protein